MRQKGFLTGPEIKPMDPEYEKLQRKNVLKQYQDQILEKKEALKALEDRRTTIETEIALAFADRLAIVEAREKAAFERENKTNGDRGILISDMEAFYLDVQSKENSLAERRAEIARLIEKNERVLAQVNLRTGDIDNGLKNVDAFQQRLQKFEDDLNVRKAAIDREYAGLETRKGEITAEHSSLLELRNAVSVEKETLSLSRLANEKQLTDMAALRDRLKEIKKETDEKLEALRIERAENDRVYRANLDTAKQFKSRQKELDELDAKLKTWEADLTNIKTDLETREERVKNLEKKSTGK